jgi:3-hydroxyacyl-CoA dehydrogenase/enoyl-CoA hydratase/3-hydroxybutyryl-CoA epimerase
MELFFQRERVKKSAADIHFTPPRAIAVVGAGVMGAGIAQWVASHNIPVRLQDVSPEALARGLGYIEKLTADAKRHHKLTSIEARATLDRLTPIDAEPPLRGVDWVIEAAAEKLEIKQAIFRRLEARVAPETILATNTSALSIDAITDGLAHPGRVVGLHFFNPVHRMPLVEIVRGPRTSSATVDAARRLVLALDKLPVVVRDRPGFLVNRVLMPGLVEAIRLFHEGLPVSDIDRALLDFGLPMGPLRLADEVGLDIAQHVARDLAERLPHLAAPDDTLERMLAHGWLGKKSGQGFYQHSTRSEPRPNPSLRTLLLPRSGTAEPFRLSPADIADRVILVMVNEAARCLDEGVVESAADLDFAMILGTGWAPFRGGPLHHADALGLPAVVARLDALSTHHPHLAPCDALRQRARDGCSFFNPTSP